MSDVAYVCGVSGFEPRQTEPAPERWCFGERKRQTGKHVLMAPGKAAMEYIEQTGAWGWAEPYWEYHCDGCGKDRRAGFGGEIWYEYE